MKKIITFTLIALFWLPVAQAEVSGFAGFGGGLVTFDDSSAEVKPKNLYGRVGASFNQYFDLGAEFSFSLIDDSIGNVDWSTSILFLYAKANLPINEQAKLYVMAGASDITLTATAGNATGDTDDNGTGYGFGFEYALSEEHAFNIDYIKYYDDTGFGTLVGETVVESVNIGVTYNF